MGLDMYLSKKTYVKQWGHQEPKDKFNVIVTKGQKLTNIKSERVSYVEEELMYWRKANQIHGWFTQNTNEVVADVTYSVTKTDLEVLLETCKKVVEILESSPKITKKVDGGWENGEKYLVDVEVYDNEVLEDILPPTQGFFFGSDTIDDYYKDEIVRTIDFLENELPNCNNSDEFEYHASW